MKIEICAVYIIASLLLWVFFDLYLLFKLFSSKAKGTIVDITWRKDSGSNRKIYTSVFEVIINGNKHKCTNDLWGSKPRFQIGEEVEVEFLKGYEEHARIPSFMRSILLLSGFGLAAIAIYSVKEKWGIDAYMELLLVVNFILCVAVLYKYFKIFRNRHDP